MEGNRKEWIVRKRKGEEEEAGGSGERFGKTWEAKTTWQGRVEEERQGRLHYFKVS